MSGSPSLDDLKLALADRIEDVARTLFGEPNKASVRRPEWRWGTFGSRALMVRGPKRGLFMDHEGGKGGSLLDAIMVARSCDFVGAVQWSKSYLGINGSEPTPPDPEVLREREQERAAAEAAQQTDEAKRLAYARQLWDASVSSSGTAADVYLTDARAIPRPADGWPSVVRYHPASGALIVAGTDDAGIVQFVHRVYLTVDGHKVSGSQPKLTNGLMAGAVVRLPGSASSPLLLAEELRPVYPYGLQPDTRSGALSGRSRDTHLRPDGGLPSAATTIGSSPPPTWRSSVRWRLGKQPATTSL